MINRQKAIKRAKEILYEKMTEVELYYAAYDRYPDDIDAEYTWALAMAIEALSQPERPKGRWELIQDDWNVYQCSECKEWWTLESGTPQENSMNFCPNCGADMRGETDD